MAKKVEYEEVFQFMKEFGIELMTHNKELIFDEKTNTYCSIEGCSDMWDVKTQAVYSLCRPIGKGLKVRDAERLLKRLNTYFKTSLTREDMRLMYQELCYNRKLGEFKGFIKRGFPMDELRKVEELN